MVYGLHSGSDGFLRDWHDEEAFVERYRLAKLCEVVSEVEAFVQGEAV